MGTNQLGDFGIDAEFLDSSISLRLMSTRKIPQTCCSRLCQRQPAFPPILPISAEIENQGFEVAVSSRNTTGSFPLADQPEFSANRNEITELSSDSDIPVQGPANTSGWSILRVGQPLGAFFDWKSSRYFPVDAEAQSPCFETRMPEAGDRRYEGHQRQRRRGNLTGKPDGVIGWYTGPSSAMPIPISSGG